MINITRSSLLPSIDSFQSSILLTSTPKRSNKISYSQPLSSTLTTRTTNSYQKIDLSISAITTIKKSSYQKKKYRYHYRRQSHRYPFKRIELKYLLYSTEAMKKKDIKPCYHEMKIYVI